MAADGLVGNQSFFFLREGNQSFNSKFDPQTEYLIILPIVYPMEAEILTVD